jgi:hypothetical protein
MKTLLAKTKVAEVTDFGNDNKRTRLTRPEGTSEENKTFSAFTPQISVEILVNNPEAVDFFKAGEEVYITFSKDKPLKHDSLDLLKNAYLVLSDLKGFSEKCPDGGNLTKVIGWALTEANIKTFKVGDDIVDMDFIQNQTRINADNFSDLYNTACIGATFDVPVNGRRLEAIRLT